MLKRRPRKTDLHQIWPEARRGRAHKRYARSRLSWGTPALVVLGVFVGGMAATAFVGDRGFAPWGNKLEGEPAAPLPYVAQLSALPVTPSREQPQRAEIEAPAPAPAEPIRTFGFCHTGGGQNCIIDGDTFWMDGVKIRVADIDAPETHPPRCDYEADLGNRATDRLRELLNVGPFEVEPLPGRDEDRYGRKLRVVTRDGQSLGDQLVSEGLARTWTGQREPWC